MKICLRPQPHQLEGGGVKRRLEALWKYLPEYGVEFVDSPGQADLVHCHAIAQAIGYAHSLVYTNHGVYELTEDSPAHEWTMNRIIVRNLRLARRVISVAQWPTGIYAGDLGVEPAVIPNGVELEAWKKIPKGLFIQKHQVERPFFLWAKISSVGVSDPTPVVELAKRLPEYDFVTTFAPAGAPRLPNLRVVGRLSFNEMQHALADCVGYLATTKENFSVQVVEAMACGKPILGYAWGGTAEAVHHDREGWLVEPGDLNALAEGAKKCVEESKRYGKAARRRVHRTYRWEDLMRQVYEVYEAALEEKRREAAAPKVCVVVPNYNYEQFLPEALHSIQMQTFADFECRIVDDASANDPKPVIKDFLKDKRFQLMRHKKNQGVSQARNTGIAASDSPLIMCLDADDLLEPDALQYLMAPLMQNEELGIAYGQMRMRRGDAVTDVGKWPRDFNLEALKRGNIIPTCCLFRRKAWRAAGGYPAEPNVEAWSWEDYDFWLAMASRGWGGKFVEQPTFQYRQHGASRITEAALRMGGFQRIIRQRHARLYGTPDARPIGTYDYEQQRRISEPNRPAAAGRRLVRYGGAKKGALTFHGPISKTSYRFSAISPEAWVDVRDLPYLTHPSLQIGEVVSELVSIVVPVYNQAEFLVEALDSALSQDYPEVEIVVVDDGSEDDIEMVLQQYAQSKNLQVLRHPANQGLAAARNTGIRAAKGGLILPLDADDILAPFAVSRLVEAMRQHGPHAVIYSDFWMFGAVTQQGRVYELDDYDFDALLKKNLIPATSMFPRVAWEQAQGFKPEMSQLGGWEDYEFWISLGKRGYCGHRLREALWGYRQHRDSMRKGALRNKKALQDKLMELHSDVYGGIKPMGCCGGKSGRGGGRSSARGAASSQAASNSQAVPAGRGIGMAPLVEVEYTGTKRGSFTVQGQATRTRYKFSATASRKFVDRRDAEKGLGAQFRIVPPAPAPPPAAPVIAEPIEPEKPLPVPEEGQAVPPQPSSGASVDFSILKGVGPKSDELLRHGLGFQTLADLVDADASMIAAHLQMPGDNLARVHGWQAQAQRLQGDSAPFA